MSQQAPQQTVVTTATIPGQLPVTAIQGQPQCSGNSKLWPTTNTRPVASF